MIEAIARSWPGLLLLFALLAVVGWRMPVIARGRMSIKAPADHVFSLIDLRDGGEQHWHRADVMTSLIDPESRLYRIRYAIKTAGGERVFHAEFRVLERTEPARLVLERSGLEGRPRTNELLKITFDLTPVGEETNLALAYHWGPRPLLAQFIARTDLYGSLYRIKTLAETGTASSRAETWLTAVVAVATGLVTLLGFGLWLDWIAAVSVVVALFIHEFGHLLAFRLIGQSWGRLVFLPFMGAIAMPRLPFRSDGQHAFAALMGPAFSVVGLLPTLAAPYLGFGSPYWLAEFGGIVALLNLFNLMPVEPLDGGVAWRTVLRRFFGSRTHLGMVASSAAIALLGLALKSPVLLALGGIAAVLNLKPRSAGDGLAPLTTREAALVLAGFIVITAAHIVGLGTLVAHYRAGWQ